MTSPSTSVESTSITTSRIARRCRPPRCTATSARWSSDSRARAVRRRSGSAPETSSSMQVTGRSASRPIRSMLAPLGGDPARDRGDHRRLEGAAEHGHVQPAAAPGLLPEPIVISASSPRSAAIAATSRWIAVRSVRPRRSAGRRARACRG